MSFPLNPVDNQVYKNYYFDSSANAWRRNDFDPVGTIKKYDGTNWIDGVTKPGWFACIPENADKDCPDMTDRFAMGKNISSNRVCGGANLVALNIDHIPSHDHGMKHIHDAIFCNSTHSHTSSCRTDSHSECTGGCANHSHNVVKAPSRPANTRGGSSSVFTCHVWCITGGPIPANFVNNHSAHSHTVGGGSHNHAVCICNTQTKLTTNTGNCCFFNGNISGDFHDNKPSFYSMIYIRKCF